MNREHLSRRHDVVIIGAGIAGLTAAHLLLKARPDLDLLVLEAKDRIGGRLLSKPVRCADGEVRQWCFGGTWASKTQCNLLELLKEMKIETFEQYRQGIKFVEMDNTVTQYEGGVPTIGLLNLLDLNLTLQALERQATGLKTSQPDQVERMDQDSVKSAVQRLTFREESELFLRGVVAPVLQGSDERISQIHALNVAQSSGGFEKLFKDAQELRVDGGAQRITERLAESVGPARLRLGWAVAEIRQSTDNDDENFRGEVCLLSESGDQLTSCLVLCTLPLASLNLVKFRPTLPPSKQQLANNCPTVSHTLKTIITYANAFWRQAGFSGEILSCQGQPMNPQSVSGSISVCYDACSRDGAHPALVVLASSGADRTASPNERREALLNHLARFFPKEDVFNFIDYAEHSWCSEPYHSTCMASAVSVGCGSLLLSPELSKPFHRVHFAGSDMADEWIGYMEGAVQSAKRATAELLQAL
ncbi:hypothetical protein BOX15_Mlig030979g1 [Macrostomum lignano]|uniref:Amine oxidase n=2 Tax=Macrostomum lignano TaxID=282301 RepID=A0A1I8J490_9PLAT|nr:hypothetical protein BOX15_Mlig030979g1 [Macrostomum lignano]